LKRWWKETPWRFIQTNMRQIDMEDMDADRFVEDLKAFEATIVMVNAAGIIASYPTDLPYHFQSPCLHGDGLDKVIERCHEEGIRVIARTDFSKVRRPVYERHPEWAYRTAEGEIVDYNGDVHACVNGGYQQEYVFEIIDEMLKKLPFDGVFCNMGGFQVRDYSYRYYGVCHCESCKRKFREMFGLALPLKEDMNDPVYRKYKLFQRRCIADYEERFYRHVKALSPDIAVNGRDFVRMESNTEYGRPLPHWQYSASSNTRCIRGTGQEALPASNTTVDFIGFFYRHVAVSPALQELRMWQNLANLGGLDYYLIGRLDNHDDRSGYAGIQKVFRFHKQHEKELCGLRAWADALLIRSALWGDSSEERGWIRALTENHILFDELLLEKLEKADLSKYKAVILPDIKFLSEEQAAQLDRFAENGGVVVASGDTGLGDGQLQDRDTVCLRCMGVERVRAVRSDMVSAMLRIREEDKKDFPSFPQTDVIAFGDRFVFADISPKAQRYFGLIPPHPFGPPERCFYTQQTDIPGVTRFPYGKGYGVYLPWLAGTLFCREGYENTAGVMRDVLQSLAGLPSAAPALTPMVEVTAAGTEDRLVVQLVNNSGHFGTSYYPPIPVEGIEVVLPVGKEPRSAASLKAPGNASFQYKEGLLRLRIERLEEYEAAVVRF
jgi:hypothetical protein